MTTTIQPVETGEVTDPTDDAERPRTSFRQPVSSEGYLDAVWWPRTLDLTAELPPLLDVLWTAGREITRCTYNLRAWDPAPRSLQSHGYKVRLGGFATSDPQTVRLSDAWGRERIDVLVLPPQTGATTARGAFRLIGEATNRDHADGFLARATGSTDPA